MYLSLHTCKLIRNVNDVMVLVLILGPDWDRGEEDGGETTVGTVIRKHSNNTVSVSTEKHSTNTVSVSTEKTLKQHCICKYRKNTQTTLYL